MYKAKIEANPLFSTYLSIGFWPATGIFFIQDYPASSETPEHPHTTANFALPEINLARFQLKANS